MNIKEKFGIEFKSKTRNSDIYYDFVINNKEYDFLYIIGLYHKIELKGLIYDLEKSIVLKKNYEESFETDTTEMHEILFHYPNITIQDLSSINRTKFTVSMIDLKLLSEEWLNFILSEEKRYRIEKSIYFRVRKFIKKIIDKYELKNG